MERDYIKQWKEITAQDGRCAGPACLQCPTERSVLGSQTVVPSSRAHNCCGSM